MMVSHEYNPIPMQDEQTQNYAAFMSDVHKTFLKSGGDRQWREKACTATTETVLNKCSMNFVTKVKNLADFKCSLYFDK